MGAAERGDPERDAGTPWALQLVNMRCWSPDLGNSGECGRGEGEGEGSRAALGLRFPAGGVKKLTGKGEVSERLTARAAGVSPFPGLQSLAPNLMQAGLKDQGCSLRLSGCEVGSGIGSGSGYLTSN